MTTAHGPDPASPAHPSALESAGALVWRRRAGELQVQLVHRPRYDDWSWPKGKLDDGETSQAAAMREVAEETGRPIVLGRPLPGLRYLTPEGRVKRVRYWAGRRTRKGHDTYALVARPPVAPVDRREIDRAAWLGADDAAARLTRAADRRPLEALVAADDAGLLVTRAVVIARHGQALARTRWHGSERDRPLTPVGHAHAAALVPVLASYGVEHVISSRWERCATTIDPYVRAAGLRPAFSEYLTEARHEHSPSRVAAAMRDLLSDTDESAVLCTHRPVMPTVMEVLAEHSPPEVAAALPAQDPYLNPGTVLVAHVAATPDGPQVVAVEKVAPPLY
ncbi:NUDIX hydrolase [Myceligenerans crystallogenes]|uniref:NUDIX hydrolase n=1 Tax=Myceligenerans crystallogenes TaxID=316335 RepID=A0ABN2N5G0_9MICO